MVSGEATGLQRGAFRHPCLCDRIKMGYLGLCDLGSQAPGPSCRRRCADSREGTLNLSCKLGSGSRTGEGEAQCKGAAERRRGQQQDKDKLGNLSSPRKRFYRQAFGCSAFPFF